MFAKVHNYDKVSIVFTDTINEESLMGLTGDYLVILNNNGHLEPIYMAIASMSNISTLVQMKNKLLEDNGADVSD